MVEVLPVTWNESYHIDSFYQKVPSLIDGTFRQRPCFFRDDKERAAFNAVVDSYVREVRMKARRKCESASPAQLIQEAAERGETVPCPMEVKSFDITRAVTLLWIVLQKDNFSGLRWCDMSAGWGVHLMTALYCGMDYYACDPNKEMTPIYQRMIADNRWTGSQVVEEKGFEDAVIEAGTFDVFFSSPPFFDWEIYSQDEGQSVIRFPNFIDWMTNFLFVAYAKGVEALKVGGYYLLYIGDVKTIRFCEASLMYINYYHPEMEYHGVISCGGKTNLRPTFVWKKTATPAVNRPNLLDYCYRRMFLHNNMCVGGPSLTIKAARRGLLGQPKYSLIEDNTVQRGLEVHFLDSYNIGTFIMAADQGSPLISAFNACREKYKKKGTVYVPVINGRMKGAKVKGVTYWDYTDTTPGKKMGIIFSEAKQSLASYIQGLRKIDVVNPANAVTIIDFVPDINYLQKMEESLRPSLANIKCDNVWITSENLDVYRALGNAWPSVKKFNLLVVGPKYYKENFDLALVKKTYVIEATGTTVDNILLNAAEGDIFWKVTG